MTDTITLNRLNSNTLKLLGLRYSSNGAYVSDGTVTATLKLDSTGDPVTGANGLTLTLVSGSDGNYLGEIPYSVSLTAGAAYTLEVTADSGTKRGFWPIPVQVVNRTS